MDLSSVDILELALILFVFLSSFLFFDGFFRRREIKKLKHRIIDIEISKEDLIRNINEVEKSYKELLKSQKEKLPSLELTEFLTDQSRYGYSFVRVDPRGVMIRSPRDY